MRKKKAKKMRPLVKRKIWLQIQTAISQLENITREQVTEDWLETIEELSSEEEETMEDLSSEEEDLPEEEMEIQLLHLMDFWRSDRSQEEAVKMVLRDMVEIIGAQTLREVAVSQSMSDVMVSQVKSEVTVSQIKSEVTVSQSMSEVTVSQEGAVSGAAQRMRMWRRRCPPLYKQ
jgi:hypothetical protein